MKARTIALLLAAAFTTTGQAAIATPQRELPVAQTLEPVQSIPAIGRLHRWSVVDDDTLIIWAGPRQPYLVRLFRPSPELKFALAIGVTSFGNRIHARFDSVEVEGFSYPIREIYRMSRVEAETLQARS